MSYFPEPGHDPDQRKVYGAVTLTLILAVVLAYLLSFTRFGPSGD